MTTGMPTILTAGDRWRWRESAAAAYPPAAGWTLKYRLRSAAAVIDITAQVVGAAYEIDVAPATTATYAAAEYDWTAWVEKSGDRVSIATGRVTVRPDPATIAAGDIRSHAEKVLEAIHAVIEGRASQDQESYSINGRSLSRTSLPDLLALERTYARRVARERAEREAAAGRGGGGTINITFGDI